MNAKPERQRPSGTPGQPQSNPQRPQPVGSGQPTSEPQPASSSPPATGASRQTPAGQSARPRSLAGLPRAPRPRTQRSRTEAAEPPERLVSLDAFRGFIMIMLAASGFGILQLTRLAPTEPVWKVLDYDLWQQIGFHFDHPIWLSDFRWQGLPTLIAFWDLIQPAFMFMVGVAMPYSFARRDTLGHGVWRRTAHALWRAIVLILLGVFLSSAWAEQTNWTFVNVLSQIGLGYVFVYALMGRRFWIQLSVFVLILVGYWGYFYSYTPPEGYDYAAVGATPETVFEGRFAPWSKNANAAHHFDVWLLNQFPRPEGEEGEEEPFRYNEGGYVTLNFIPSIATMLLGVFCGQLLRSDKRWWQKFLLLVLGAAVCLGLGVLASQYACPVVKRIWTPSWVLLSGGWVIGMLAVSYLVFDLCRLRWLAFPLIVVGMNSIFMYMMGQLMRPWVTRQVDIHFTPLLQRLLGTEALADNMFGLVIAPTSALIVFWLIVFWMYRHKYFVRI